MTMLERLHGHDVLTTSLTARVRRATAPDADLSAGSDASTEATLDAFLDSAPAILALLVLFEELTGAAGATGLAHV